MLAQSGLGQFLTRLVDQASLRLAVAGDGSGTVDVPGRPNWIYARRGSSAGEVFECHVSAVHPNHGDIFYYLPEHPMQTGGERLVFWLRDASDVTLPPPIAGSTRTLSELTDDADAALTDDSDVALQEG